MRAIYIQNVLFIYRTYDVCGHGLSDFITSVSPQNINCVRGPVQGTPMILRNVSLYLTLKKQVLNTRMQHILFKETELQRICIFI